MNPIVKEILMAMLRHGLTVGAAFFLAHNWVTVDQMHWLASDQVVNWLFVFLSASLVPILLSVYSSMKDKLKINLAHSAAPTTTIKAIDNQVSNAPLSAILTADPSKLP